MPKMSTYQLVELVNAADVLPLLPATGGNGTVTAAQLFEFIQDLMVSTIQVQIVEALAAYDAGLQARLLPVAADNVGPVSISGQDFANLALFALYIDQKAGQSGSNGPAAPLPGGAFPLPLLTDLTIDFNQTDVVVTPVTIASGGPVTTRKYRWHVGTPLVPQANLWDLGILLANSGVPPTSGLAVAPSVGGAVALPSTQPILLEELLYTAEQPYPTGIPVSVKSQSAVINAAAAALPTNTTRMTTVGTPGADQTIQLTGGIWNGNGSSIVSNGYTYIGYDGLPPELGGNGQIIFGPLTGQTPPINVTLTAATYAGKTAVYFGNKASNANGLAAAYVYADPISIPTGQKSAAIAPVGIEYATSYPVGTPIKFHYGTQPGEVVSDYWSNNPSATGFTVQVERDGVATSGGGANVKEYTPVPADDGKMVRYGVTPSNSAGNGTTAWSAGVKITPQVGGGGGGSGGGGTGPTISFVGTMKNGGQAVSSIDLAIGDTSPAPPQTSDLVLITRSNNGPIAWDAVTGFTQVGSTLTLTAIGEETDANKKIVVGGEPSAYTLSMATPDYLGAIGIVMRSSSGSIDVVDAQTVQTPSGGSTTSASPLTVDIAACTSTDANQRIVVAIALDQDVAGSVTWDNLPAGFSIKDQIDFSGNSAVDFASIVVLEGPVSGVGAQAAKTIRATVAGAALAANAFTFVIG